MLHELITRVDLGQKKARRLVPVDVAVLWKDPRHVHHKAQLGPPTGWNGHHVTSRIVVSVDVFSFWVLARGHEPKGIGVLVNWVRSRVCVEDDVVDDRVGRQVVLRIGIVVDRNQRGRRRLHPCARGGWDGKAGDAGEVAVVVVVEKRRLPSRERRQIVEARIVDARSQRHALGRELSVLSSKEVDLGVHEVVRLRCAAAVKWHEVQEVGCVGRG